LLSAESSNRASFFVWLTIVAGLAIGPACLDLPEPEQEGRFRCATGADCIEGWVCSDGHCARSSASCTPAAREGCHQGDLWSFDSCDNPESLTQACTVICCSNETPNRCCTTQTSSGALSSSSGD
jgi:hypothetical protein